MIKLFKKKTPEYQISCDFIEKQIELDISNYLGLLSTPESHFKIVSEDEPLTGSDARFDCAIPMYLQFKVSHGLKSIEKVKPSTRKNRSKLEDIRIYRNEKGLLDNPTLYFGLRAKAKNADDFQHNILMDYNVPEKSFAFYVAPLSLRKDEYEKSLFDSVHLRNIHYPFFFHDDIGIYIKHAIKSIGTIPFLRQHISIVPHDKVDTHKHHYSYSKTGSDIAFHSKGKTLPYNVSRFSDLLQKILQNAFTSQNSWQSFEEIIKNLKVISKEHDLKSIASDSNSQIQNLRDFGRQLYSKYGIKQYLIMTQREQLSKI
jgi:hypothetical protein